MKPLLLDSNLVIHAADSDRSPVVDLVSRSASVAVSVVTVIETLGYHAITPVEKAGIQSVLDACVVIPLDDDIVAKAIELRQQRRIKLGNAIIAASALVHQRTLATRNTADFARIARLDLIDPYVST